MNLLPGETHHAPLSRRGSQVSSQTAGRLDLLCIQLRGDLGHAYDYLPTVGGCEHVQINLYLVPVLALPPDYVPDHLLPVVVAALSGSLPFGENDVWAS